MRRWLLSFGLALVLVSAVVAAGLTFFERPRTRPESPPLRVAAATPQEIAAARKAAGALAPAPVQRGFVQLRFRVTPAGRARDVVVAGAVPAGVFDAQAVARIEAQSFEPAGAGADQRAQIVEFSYIRDATGALRPVP